MQKLLKTNAATNLIIAFSLVGSLFFTHQAKAQMYKWVGPNGKIVYSDTPPPPNAKKLASKALDTNASVSTANLPPDLAAAVNKNPVVIYTAPNCGACNEGRNLLKQAGIPFIEKTVKTNDDVTKLNQVSGDTSLPFMQIGKAKFKGLDALEWRAALSAGGYPETNMLPRDFKYPEAEPASPPALSENKTAESKPQDLPKPKSSSASGIRF